MGSERGPDEPSSRRTLLKMVGAGALATTTAGCNFGDVTSREFEATPYGYGPEGLQLFGFEEFDHREHEETRRISAGDFEGEVTVRSQLVSYGREAAVPPETSWKESPENSWSAGVLSTPEARIAGESRNPVATEPLSELVTGDTGRQFLSLVGIDSEWDCPPQEFGRRQGEVLGHRAEVRGYLGTVDTGDGVAAVTLHGTRIVTDDGDAVLAGAVDRRATPDGTSPPECPSGGDDLGELVPEDEELVIREQVRKVIELVETVGPLTELPDPDPSPSLSIENPRIVQKAEDSEIQSGVNQGTGPDPAPLVVNDACSVVFDLDGSNLDLLGNTAVTAEITMNEGPSDSTTEAFDIPADAVRSIADGDHPAAKFHELARDGNPDTNPPLFTVDPESVDLEVRPKGESFSYDRTSWDVDETVDLGDATPLRVGFIHVKDPGSHHSPVLSKAQALLNPSKVYKTDIDWGNASGEAEFYERSVNSSVEFLQRVYPGEVIAYRHDNPMIAHIQENWSNPGAASKDAAMARTTLNLVRQLSGFPNGGTIYSGSLSKQEAIDEIDADSGGAFDVRVMILPKGTAEGNVDYFSHHGSLAGAAGYFFDLKRAVASLEAVGDSPDTAHVQTTAQEIAHRYSFTIYTGTISAGSNDVRHVTPSLESVGYDMTGGKFSLINDVAIRDGSFGPGSPETDATGRLVANTFESYMKPAAGGDTWADTLIQRYLAEAPYDPGYSGGGSPVLSRGARADRGDSTGASDRAEVQPVLEAYGGVEDGEVRFDASMVYDAIPEDADGGDYETFGTEDARPVEVALLDPDDGEVVTATVPDRVRGSHAHDDHGPHESVAVSLPFRDRAVWLTAMLADETTMVNAVVRPIRDTVERLPERAFRDDAEETREAMLGALDEVDADMRAERYGEASEKLREFADSEAVARVRTDYERFANEPDREVLRALVDRMVDHLDGV